MLCRSAPWQKYWALFEQDWTLSLDILTYVSSTQQGYIYKPYMQSIIHDLPHRLYISHPYLLSEEVAIPPSGPQSHEHFSLDAATLGDCETTDETSGRRAAQLDLRVV